MGCDIHTITEIKENEKWKQVEEVPKEFDERNYSTFAFLANVRNNFDTIGFEAKGLPADLSSPIFKTEYGEDDLNCEDYHSHSYLTLKELSEADLTDYSSVKCKIIKDFYDKFIELGGILPDGMEIKSEERTPASIIEALRYSFQPDIIVKWQANAEEIEKYPVVKGINTLKEIADKYNIKDYNDIRIVFAFDN